MPQRNIVIMLAAALLSYACYLRADHSPYARYVASGLTAIEGEALDHLTDEELFEGAMRGMVDVLHARGDEHSQFLPKKEADPLRDEIRQQFGGIGVRIRLVGEPPRLLVVGPIDPSTPAARGKLFPGDRILTIDDQSTESMTLADAQSRLRGEPGSTVRLTVQNEQESRPRSIELERQVIAIESVLGEVHSPEGQWEFMLTENPRLALIRITSFGDRTAEELNRVLDQLVAGGVQGVILDLRDNPGGPLDMAVAVCDMFLPADKTIVETRGRDAKLIRRYITTGQARFLSLPLAILVNQNTASAAEIVAACLQDHGRAIVVGQRSYGKGTVQQLVPMESGRSLLKLTWASFWRPDGINIHRKPGASEAGQWGVTPSPGGTLQLSTEEYASYLRWRADRDLLNLGEMPEDAARDEFATEKEFIDRQLALAVELLQASLDAPAQ